VLWGVVDPLDIVELVAAAKDEVRKHPDISYMVLDYFTMYSYNVPARDQTVNQQVAYIKNHLASSKDFPGLSIIVAYQVTKAAAKGARQDGGSLDSADAMQVRDDPHNLYFSLQPELRKDPDNNVIGYEDYGTLRITKNNLGDGYRKVYIGFDPVRLRWIDQELTEADIAAKAAPF
jgi:hypothetical protein